MPTISGARDPAGPKIGQAVCCLFRAYHVLPTGRILPVDLGPHYENLRMDPVYIRPVPRRRQLQHIDPVCHEADPDVGIPVEANREICLPAALDVGRDADRLED